MIVKSILKQTIEADIVVVDGRMITEERLRVILQHFDATHILIQSAKKNKDYKALSDWDDARNKK